MSLSVRERVQRTRGLLHVLGFENTSGDRDGVEEWRHARTGLVLDGDEIEAIKDDADLVRFIYNAGQHVGAAQVRQEIIKALGLEHRLT